MPGSRINRSDDERSIKDAIIKAISESFQKALPSVVNPYKE